MIHCEQEAGCSFGVCGPFRDLGESTAQAKACHLGVTAVEKGSGLCASWVGQVLRESLGWGQFDGDSNLVLTCTCRLG